MLRFLLKEATVLTAFIILGALLLLSLWLSNGVNDSLIKEFRDPKISVIIPESDVETFKAAVESDSNVVRYDLFQSVENKARLSELYPELRNVISPLELRFFPVSALVTVKDAEAFLKVLNSMGLGKKQIVHEPPQQLGTFLRILTMVLLGLWMLTLSLVLYFNVERQTVKEEARWSLMKMLGAQPFRIFLPLWLGQSIRITISACCAIALAWIASQQMTRVFAWNWTSLPASVWVGFFVVSLLLTWTVSFLLFNQRFRRISLG